jgi:hypothetical protein
MIQVNGLDIDIQATGKATVIRVAGPVVWSASECGDTVSLVLTQPKQDGEQT